MSKTVTIPLSEPITEHRKTYTEIVVREPTWADIIGVGAPYTIHRDREDKAFLVYDETAIAHYVEACVVEPSTILMDKVGMREALAVREAIVGFFLAAAVGTGAAAGSTTSPTNSGSTAASVPMPSAG